MTHQQEFINQIFIQLKNIECDRQSIPQEKLDIEEKKRHNIFNWRGQFSPQFIEVILNNYSQKNSVILDPFAGSGTTIFESASQQLTCYGADINPAAITMAKTADFINLNLSERKKIIADAKAIIEEYLRPCQWDLFSYQLAQQNPSSEQECLRNLYKNQNNYPPLISNIITNIYLRLYQSKNQGINQFNKLFLQHSNLIENLPYSPQKYQIFHTDAKSIPLADQSIDLIVTSPPYINVFNYHQNYREVMEMIGWDVLKVAKSEIGANRKYRQNRFLTVIQYSLDMLEVLQEMRRLLTKNGRIIIVIGRKSNIRNVSIENTKLVATLGIGGSNFRLDSVQERKFKNKFGEIIYEDILHFIPNQNQVLTSDEFSRLVAQNILLEIYDNADISQEVKAEILAAYNYAEKVQKSPIFKPYNHDLTLIKNL
jgi:DNA modification methylase